MESHLSKRLVLRCQIATGETCRFGFKKVASPPRTMLQFLLAYFGLFWCVCFLVSLWVCAAYVLMRAVAHIHFRHVFIRQSRVLRIALCSVLGDNAKFARRLSFLCSKTNHALSWPAVLCSTLAMRFTCTMFTALLCFHFSV